FDTMLVHSIIGPDMKHGLDFLAAQYLHYRPISINSLLGDPPQREMNEVPLDALYPYACEDADVTWQLAAKLRPVVVEREAERVCYEVECPLVPVLIDMEHEGIRIDSQALQRYSRQLAEDISQL